MEPTFEDFEHYDNLLKFLITNGGKKKGYNPILLKDQLWPHKTRDQINFLLERLYKVNSEVLEFDFEFEASEGIVVKPNGYTVPFIDNGGFTGEYLKNKTKEDQTAEIDRLKEENLRLDTELKRYQKGNLIFTSIDNWKKLLVTGFTIGTIIGWLINEFLI